MVGFVGLDSKFSLSAFIFLKMSLFHPRSWMIVWLSMQLDEQFTSFQLWGHYSLTFCFQYHCWEGHYHSTYHFSLIVLSLWLLLRAFLSLMFCNFTTTCEFLFVYPLPKSANSYGFSPGLENTHPSIAL